jgi:hypothetical protein
MLHKGHGVVLLQQRLVEFSSSIRKTHADRSFIDKKHFTLASYLSNFEIASGGSNPCALISSWRQVFVFSPQR